MTFAGAPSPGQGQTTRIGRFEVRRQLGEGAFGRVYEAYDPKLERAVALKVAKPERLTSELRVERFLREGKSAANLRHPNIVPVFEAGRDGAHYYIASALITGTTLEHNVSESPPEARVAVALVRQLAEALGYAHSRGVVHRDVKPSNVLLDERGDALLADFGLAARESAGERLTQEGGWVGTPAYLAPEQAAGEASPASDQYSLGCVLYELLTGQAPFSGPPELVVFLHTSKEPPPPRKVNRQVPRDLETVTLKCLEKDPAKRYPSCLALADDLRRWAEGEPTTARPLGLPERAARWARREPRLAAALSLAAGLLVGITALSAWSAVTYRRLTREATESAKEADYRFEQAGRAVDDYLLRVTDDEQLKAPQLSPLRRQLLAHGLRYYEDFLAKRSDDARLRQKFAVAHLRQAFIQQEMGSAGQAEAAYAEAFRRLGELRREQPANGDIGRELVLGLLRYADLQAAGTGTREKAREKYQEANGVLELLARDDPEDLGLLTLRGRLTSRLAAWHKADRSDSALRYGREAVALRKRVADRLPNEEAAMRDLAESYTELGGLLNEARDLKPALAAYLESRRLFQALGEADSDRRAAQSHEARVLHDIAILHHQVGEMTEAEKARRRAMQLREGMLYGQAADLVADLAQTYNDLGVHLTKGSRPGSAEGLRLLELAREQREKLAAVHGQTPRFLRELAQTYNNLGRACVEQKDHAAAMSALDRAVGALDRIPADRRQAAEFLEERGLAYHLKGYLHIAQKQFPEATQWLSEAKAVREQLRREPQKRKQYRGDLLATYVMLGNAALQMGRDESIVHYGRASKLAEEQVAEAPDEAASHSLLAITLHSLGNAQYRIGKQPSLAVSSLARAVSTQQKAAELAPQSRQFRTLLEAHNRLLAEVRKGLNDPR